MGSGVDGGQLNLGPVRKNSQSIRQFESSQSQNRHGRENKSRSQTKGISDAWLLIQQHCATCQCFLSLEVSCRGEKGLKYFINGSL